MDILNAILILTLAINIVIIIEMQKLDLKRKEAENKALKEQIEIERRFNRIIKNEKTSK